MFAWTLADKRGQVWHSGWHENKMLFALSGGEKNGKTEKRESIKVNSTLGRDAWVVTL